MAFSEPLARVGIAVSPSLLWQVAIVSSPNATLIFTGHSLGGALSPTLALDLAVNLGFDLTKWAAVYVYPSAGPTPGNKKFADFFQRTFPARTVESGRHQLHRRRPARLEPS